MTTTNLPQDQEQQAIAATIAEVREQDTRDTMITVTDFTQCATLNDSIH